MDGSRSGIVGWFWRSPLKRWISRTFFKLPQDGAALWTLTPERDRPSVDVLRLGACEAREMNGCHSITAPVGYPRYMGEELEAAGASLGFQNMFVWHLADWPDGDMLLKRRRRQRAGEPPDLVLLQVGGWSAMKTILGFHRRLVGLREHLGRWVGPLIWPIHSFQALFFRRFGRVMPEQGFDELERFVGLVRELWPGVRIVVMEPWRSGMRGAFDEERLARATADLQAAAERMGCDWMPAPRFGRGRALRCSNGYNLNAAGSRLAARHYATWLVEHDCLVPPRSSTANVAAATTP